MAIVKPFTALRPEPALAGRISELPYDVLSSSEARQAAAGNPLSFFHVSKAEIDLDPAIKSSDERVYAQAKLSFDRLIQDGRLRRDHRPCFYLYQQTMERHTQLGMVAVTSCEDYLHNVIRKHELTRPDKEDDRVRHIEVLNAQTGPAFLTYPADRVLDEAFARRIATPPDFDFQTADAVRHAGWTIDSPETIALIQERFAKIPTLYIADGHHRSAAAARVYTRRQGAGHSGFFLSVIFPDNQVQILPYHRVLRDLNGLASDQVLEKLSRVFEVKSQNALGPLERHRVGFYLEGKWHTLQFRLALLQGNALEDLDVSLLQRHVLEPIFGIDNPRTSERIQFVGGIRGTPELERLVNQGEASCAFAMFPTSIGELLAVAERGGLMPPKSTWFEPKLRDGLFSHMLGS